MFLVGGKIVRRIFLFYISGNRAAVFVRTFYISNRQAVKHIISPPDNTTDIIFSRNNALRIAIFYRRFRKTGYSADIIAAGTFRSTACKRVDYTSQILLAAYCADAVFLCADAAAVRTLAHNRLCFVNKIERFISAL